MGHRNLRRRRAQVGWPILNWRLPEARPDERGRGRLRRSMAKHICFVEASTSGAGEVANRLAKKKGCFVTLFTRDAGAYSPAILEHVDQVTVCETNDPDQLVEHVRKLARTRPVDGITTTADFYVPQASKAAEEMGLPSLTYKAASEVRNKYRMRVNLERFCPELNPPFRLVHDTDEALDAAESWGYPFIAKPQDGNDSLDVNLIRDEAELFDYMRRAETWGLNSAGQPFAKGVLLEGYIDGLNEDGLEPSVETMQFKGGRLELIGVTHKVLVGFERGHFAEIGSNFAARSERADILFGAVSKALSKLDIDCGVIHTELRIQNGQPKILEINPRLIGDKVGSHVIELALGTSPVDALIDIALGDERPWRPTTDRAAAILGICMPRLGRFCGIENMDELRRMPGVAHVLLNTEIGKRIDVPSSNRDVLAQVITAGDTREEALELARRATERARVCVGD